MEQFYFATKHLFFQYLPFSMKRDPLKSNVISPNYRASAFYVTFYTQVLKIEAGIIARIFF